MILNFLYSSLMSDRALYNGDHAPREYECGLLENKPESGIESDTDLQWYIALFDCLRQSKETVRPKTQLNSKHTKYLEHIFLCISAGTISRQEGLDNFNDFFKKSKMKIAKFKT